MENTNENAELSPETEPDWPNGAVVQQEVEEVTSGIKEATDESTLSEKVEALRESLNDISQEVNSWRGKDYYLESIENLKHQVDGIHEEWNTLSETMRLQRERLESLLEAFPGVIETSTLRALSLRLIHLEEVVSEIVNERQNKMMSARARKQLYISIAALVITVLSWGAFIVMGFFKTA